MKLNELIEFYEKELELLTELDSKVISVRVADMLYTDINRVREVIGELKKLNLTSAINCPYCKSEEVRGQSNFYCGDCGNDFH